MLPLQRFGRCDRREQQAESDGSGPPGLSSLWRPNEGRRLHQTAARRRDRKILRHCGLWCPASPWAPPAGHGRIHDPDGQTASSDEPRELTYVDKTRSKRSSNFSPPRPWARGRYARSPGCVSDLPPTPLNHQLSVVSVSPVGEKHFPISSYPSVIARLLATVRIVPPPHSH